MVILCLTVICRVAIFTVFLYVWDRWQLGRSIDGARWDNIQNYLKTRKSKIMRHTCPSPPCCAIASYYNISELTEWQGYHLYLLVRRFMRDANWKNVCQQLWTILKHHWSGSRTVLCHKKLWELKTISIKITILFEFNEQNFNEMRQNGRWCIIGCKLVSGARLSGEPEVLPRCPQLPPHQASPEKLLPKLKTKILEAQITPSFNRDYTSKVMDS